MFDKYCQIVLQKSLYQFILLPTVYGGVCVLILSLVVGIISLNLCPKDRGK